MQSVRYLLRCLAALLLAGLWSCLSAQAARAQSCPPPFRQPSEAEVNRQAGSAQDRGFLWSISKYGVTSYLYGTMHVQKLNWIYPGPRLRRTLLSVKLLALEVDPSDPEVRRQIREPPTEGAVRFTLPEPLRQRVYARMRAECVNPPIAGASQAAPMRVTSLELLDARRDGLEAAFGSDVVLASAAHSVHKPIYSLETVSEQMRALRPANEAEFVSLLQQGLDNLDSGASRRVRTHLVNAWSTSDADAMQHYKDWCECQQTDAQRAQYKRVVDDRNLLLAERIGALHVRRGPVLVGVGALHMFGPEGLVELLRARGFTVTRVF